MLQFGMYQFGRNNPSKGGGGIPDLHFLGDSLLDNGFLVTQVTGNLVGARTTTQDGVGGTTLTQQAARWALTPQHWGKALISVDALGSGDGGVSVVDGMVANLNSGKFLYVEGPIFETSIIGSGARTTIDAQLDGIRAGYPNDYVDAFDIVRHYGTGTTTDDADIANGIWPRTFRSDGVHPNVAGRALFGQIIAEAIIARGWDGRRAASNVRVPVISNDGTDLNVFGGIWFEYPATAATYQWYKNGSPLSGATSASYTLIGTEADDEFYCAVTRGGVTANSAPLMVNQTAETAYSTEANALINAMDFRPDTAGRIAIDAAMTRVQALASKLDWFDAPLHNAQASGINWLDPTKEASPVGYPTFSPGQGWTYNQAGGSRRNTNWVPSTAGGVWTLNSAHIGADIVTADSNVSAGVFIGDGNLLFRPRQYTTTSLARLNAPGNNTTLPAGSGVGHQVITRATNTLRAVKNGTELGTTTQTPTALPATAVIFGADQAHQGLVGGQHFGGDLTDADCAELADIYADLRAAFTP